MRAVFLGGTGRSGTTIAARLLGHHPALTTLPAELWVHVRPNGLCDLADAQGHLGRFLEWLRGPGHRRPARWQRPEGPEIGLFELVDRGTFDHLVDRFEAACAIDAGAAAAGLMRALIEAGAPDPTAAAWVEHTPDNVLRMTALHRLFPEAVFVHVIRDGRDVASSTLRVPWGPGEHSEAIRWWGRKLRRAQREADALPAGTVHTFRFEDLLGPRFEETLSEVFASLRVRPVGEPGSSRSANESELPSGELVGLAADRAHTGQWRQDVRPDRWPVTDALYAGVVESLRRDGVVVPGTIDVDRVTAEEAEVACRLQACYEAWAEVEDLEVMVGHVLDLTQAGEAAVAVDTARQMRARCDAWREGSSAALEPSMTRLQAERERLAAIVAEACRDGGTPSPPGLRGTRPGRTPAALDTDDHWPERGDSRIFVVGTGRCGTKLLRRMLDLHPSLHVIDETHWIPVMARRHGLGWAPRDALIDIVRCTRFVEGRPTLDLDDALRAELEALPERIRVSDFCDAIGVALARRQRKAMWADKTPEYGLHLRMLRWLWPGARFVHIIRDGPRVTASMIRHPGYAAMAALETWDWSDLACGWQPTRLSEARVAEVREKRPEEFSRLWHWRLMTIARQARQLPPGSYREIRYEDLVRRPESALREIASFLDLPVVPSWLTTAAGLVDPARASSVDVELPIPTHFTPAERGLALALRAGRSPSELVPDLEVVGDPVPRQAIPSPSAPPNAWPGAQRGVQVFSCMRDEALRLPWFLTCYRRLGVERFHIVDNGSTDGTRELLEREGDVCLYATSESFAASGHGTAWLNELLDEWSDGRWALIVDGDEQLVYPSSETVSLTDLTSYLDERGHEAMCTPLLDMYARRPIAATDYRPGQPFLDAAPWFDGRAAESVGPGATDGPHRRGGPRQRLFWDGQGLDHPAPWLLKKALVRWRRGLSLTKSTHLLDGVTDSDTTGLLLHFKLFGDFVVRAPEEAARGEHYRGARQYSAYAAGLRRDPALSAWYEGSVEYRDTHQLMALGLMRAGAGYPGQATTASPAPIRDGR